MKFPPERFNVFFAKLTSLSHPEEPTPGLPFNQDQSPISKSAPPPSTQDQAVQPEDDNPLFEEAVPLEDELANLLDDID